MRFALLVALGELISLYSLSQRQDQLKLANRSSTSAATKAPWPICPGSPSAATACARSPTAAICCIRRSPGLEPALQRLSAGLTKAPKVELSRLEWRLANSLDIRGNGATTPADATTGNGNFVLLDVQGQLPLAMIGDHRAQIETVNALADALKTDGGEVRIVSLPFETESGKILKSGVESAALIEAAQVLLRVGAAAMNAMLKDFARLRWSLAFLAAGDRRRHLDDSSCRATSSRRHSVRVDTLTRQMNDIRGRACPGQRRRTGSARRIKRYQDLVARGIIGQEERLDWVEQIARIKAARRLLDVQYEIQPQAPIGDAALPGGAAAGPYEIMASTMNLHMQLLHEDDLLGFLDDLRQNVHAQLLVRECRIARGAGSTSRAASAQLAGRLHHRLGHPAGEGDMRRIGRLRSDPALLIALTGQAQAEPLGRLFFTPERRAALERQRQLNIQETRTIEGSTVSLDGVVTRSSGKTTVWVNQRPQNENASGTGVTAAVSPRQSRPGRRNPRRGTPRLAQGRRIDQSRHARKDRRDRRWPDHRSQDQRPVATGNGQAGCPRQSHDR